MAKTNGIYFSSLGGKDKSLVVSSGSSLNIQSGATLTMSGTLTSMTMTGTLSVGAITLGVGAATITDAANILTITEEQTLFAGSATLPTLMVTGAGNVDATLTAPGTVWTSGNTPAFAADQECLRISVGGVIKRIPLWADA